MKKRNAPLFLIIVLILICYSSRAQETNDKSDNLPKSKSMKKTNEEWKGILTPLEYAVLREKGTDRASNDGYTQHFEKGTYVCAACNTKLFESGSKYESHCGWPSFDDAIEGTIELTRDNSVGMIRTEITCKACDGHLGHIFDDGPQETTGKRYCVNTTSIRFVKPEDE